MIKQLTVLAFTLILSAPALGQGDKVFPTFKGKNLEGKNISTDSFRGKGWLVMVGFERAQSKQMREWAVHFRQAFPDETKADYYQIAALSGSLTFMRPFIHSQMVKGAPKVARGHIMAVYAKDAVCDKLEIKDRDRVHVFALDPAGKIIHRESGPYDPAALARLSEKLRQVVPGSRTAESPTKPAAPGL